MTLAITAEGRGDISFVDFPWHYVIDTPVTSVNPPLYMFRALLGQTLSTQYSVASKVSADPKSAFF